MRRSVFVLVCLILGARSALAQPAPPEDLISADRPGLAESSAVVGPHRVQVETGIQRDSRGVEHTLFIPTLLRIGVGGDWEARVEGNTFTTSSSTDATGMTRRVSGLAPLSFGFKYHVPDTGEGTRPGVGVLGRVFPGWGTSDFRSRRVAGDLRVVADWDFAPQLSLNPNVGVGWFEGDEENAFAAFLFAVTLTYAASPTLGVFVDVGLQAPEASHGKTGVLVDAGVAYIVGRHVQLDASAGTRVVGRTAPHPFIGFGISIRSK